MKKIVTTIFLFTILFAVNSQPWQPAGDRIKTEWAEQIDSANPLPEYPRPQLERDQWLNINGLWDYALAERGGNLPVVFNGKILVPYPIESSLSGVQERVGEGQELWYHRTFTIPSSWKNKNVVLNFGAVDWRADVWLNDIKVGTHQGGYTPFSFDITPFLVKSGEPKLVVKVLD